MGEAKRNSVAFCASVSVLARGVREGKSKKR